jgi:hypothetical protein
MELSVALSSPFVGLRTFRRLHHHPLQDTRPPGGSVVALFRSTDLTASPSSSTSGRQTSRCLRRRRLLQVAQPLGVSVVAFFRSTNLPAYPSSPSLGLQTSWRLCRHLLQAGGQRCSSGSWHTFPLPDDILVPLVSY